MKKLLSLSVVMVLMLALVGCGKEGPVGPSGPAGAPGSQGPVGPNNQHTVTVDVTPATSGGSVTISCPGLLVDTTTGKVSTLTVFAYRTGDTVMIALPGNLPDVSSTYSAQLTYSVSADKVLLNWMDTNYTGIPAAFKVSISYVNP